MEILRLHTKCHYNTSNALTIIEANWNYESLADGRHTIVASQRKTELIMIPFSLKPTHVTLTFHATCGGIWVMYKSVVNTVLFMESSLYQSGHVHLHMNGMGHWLALGARNLCQRWSSQHPCGYGWSWRNYHIFPSTHVTNLDRRSSYQPLDS